MPVIAKFYGKILKIYYRQKEHNPPHLHATYGAYDGVFELIDGEMFEGNIPLKEQQIVRRFIRYYTARLIEMWETQNFEILPPIE